MSGKIEIGDFKVLKKRFFAGYYLLGRGEWSFYDRFYMTAITISTVGFGEVIDMSEVPETRFFTVLLIVFGMGIIVCFGSTVVAIIVEGEIKYFFRRNKMMKQIEKLKDHIIIFGAGADFVISPNFIGGMRMASTMISPNVVEFPDLMLRDKSNNMRVEEVTVKADSPCSGKTFAEADVLILAVRHEENYRHNPPPEFLLKEGHTFIILAPVKDVMKLRDAMKQVTGQAGTSDFFTASDFILSRRSERTGFTFSLISPATIIKRRSSPGFNLPDFASTTTL